MKYVGLYDDNLEWVQKTGSCETFILLICEIESEKNAACKALWILDGKIGLHPVHPPIETVRVILPHAKQRHFAISGSTISIAAQYEGYLIRILSSMISLRQVSLTEYPDGCQPPSFPTLRLLKWRADLGSALILANTCLLPVGPCLLQA